MSTHKLVTPSPIDQSNRAHWPNDVAVYHRIILDYHLPSQQETLFMHVKVPLHQNTYLLPLAAQEENLASFVSHSIFSSLIFALTFSADFCICELLSPVKYLLFESWWWLHQHHRNSHSFSSCSRKEGNTYWEVTGHSVRANHRTWLLFYCCQCTINWCFTLNSQ